jgi:hypothetical protein
MQINLQSNCFHQNISQLIFANTSLNNCRGQEGFFTRVDNQKEIPLAVYESDLLDEVIPLESATLLEEKNFQLNKEVPINTPLDAIFQVDSEGILHVFSRIENDTIEFDVKLKGVMNSEQLKNAKFLASKTIVE